MRVVCLSGGWLWKPPDDPGTHYPAMHLLNAVKCNITKLTTKSEVGAGVIMVSDI